MSSTRTAKPSVHTGMVNVNEVPGRRIGSSPFGGVKDSGWGVEQGVVAASKGMTVVTTTVETLSLPW